jgi:uncharacterized protein with FMN-binding domain
VKRIVLWLLSTVSALVLLLGYHTSTSSVLSTSGSESSFTGPLQAGAATGTPTTDTAPTTGTQASATVTGDAVQTRWGPVQVQLDVEGSSITHVSVLQYPDSNGRDVEISNYALPQLIQETLDAQGSDIAMISGATYTSRGYAQSLQSALDQVGA